MAENEEMEINVQCPTCKTLKNIKVPKYIFKNKKFGTLKIQIHSEICCEHEFIAFVSKKGQVRGYETIDMAIDLSQVELSSHDEKIYLRDMLKTYGDYVISSCIHAVILNSPIFILRTKYEGSRASEFTTLFNEILPDVSDDKLILVSNILERDYKKAEIDDALVISPSGLIANTPWDDISMDFEKNTIKKALDILDDVSQAFIIQDAINNLFKEALFVKKIIENQDIFTQDLKNLLYKNFDNDFDDNKIQLLKQILKYRYNVNISRIKDRSLSKLKESLW